MKKIAFVIAAAVVLVASMFFISNFKLSEQYVREAPPSGWGDVNGDGKISFNGSLTDDDWLVYAYIDEYGPWDTNHDGKTTEADIYNYTDVNLDGEVNVLDMIIIGRFIGENKTQPQSQERIEQIQRHVNVYINMSKADVDGDGNLTMNDVELIKEYAMGKIDRFPGEPIIPPPPRPYIIITVVLLIAFAVLVAIYKKKAIVFIPLLLFAFLPYVSLTGTEVTIETKTVSSPTATFYPSEYWHIMYDHNYKDTCMFEYLGDWKDDAFNEAMKLDHSMAGADGGNLYGNSSIYLKVVALDTKELASFTVNVDGREYNGYGYKLIPLSIGNHTIDVYYDGYMHTGVRHIQVKKGLTYVYVYLNPINETGGGGEGGGVPSYYIYYGITAVAVVAAVVGSIYGRKRI